MFKLKNKKNKYNSGMTYVELIVVLSIFAVMLSITMFNYNAFQSGVDIKALSNDVALKIIQAQKDSVNGELPPPLQQTAIILNLQASDPSISTIDTWAPTYGVFFDVTNSPTSFTYFADVNSNGLYDSLGQELLETFNITKGNKISQINVSCFGTPTSYSNLTITFKRPNSGATFTSTPTICANPDSVQITVSSASGANTSKISVYSSGRIQLN